MKLWCYWQQQSVFDPNLIGCMAYIGERRVRICPHISKWNMILNRMFGWYACPYQKLKEKPNESK